MFSHPISEAIHTVSRHTDNVLSCNRWGNMDELAGRIQARMREMGMVNPQGEPNVKELEARTKLGYATLQGLVRGDKNNPTLSTIVKIAEGLRVSVDWLLGSDTFDVRAYEQGREAVAKAVTTAVEKTLAEPSTERSGADPAKGRGRKAHRRKPSEEKRGAK